MVQATGRPELNVNNMWHRNLQYDSGHPRSDQHRKQEAGRGDRFFFLAAGCGLFRRGGLDKRLVEGLGEATDISCIGIGSITVITPEDVLHSKWGGRREQESGLRSFREGRQIPCTDLCAAKSR